MDFLEQLEAIGRPTIKQKSWMAEKKMVLVTRELLPGVVDECIASGLYSLDLETSGLDNRVFNGATRDHIVGACISPDGVTGYYIPVFHQNHMEHCVPFSEFASQLRRLIASPAVAIFHNGKFDHEFLQFNGGEPIGEWDDPKKWEDTLILAYIRNSRERNKRLKVLAKTLLSMEMIELDELFTKEEAAEGLDFGRLDPTWEPALWYGASDAICTFLLFKRLKDEALEPTPEGLPSQATIYVIEKLCVAATRWMERNRIPIDRPKVEELIRVGQREWLPALREVYEATSKALGRDIAPGFFKLLSGTTSYAFDAENVDTGIMDAVKAARDEAERQRLDPVEADGKGRLRVKTLQKRVPNLVEKKVIDTVEFPLVYDVLIPEELGLLLRELGVQGLQVTEKSGQVQTSKDVLDRVIEEAGAEYPYIGKVKRFREVAKAIASNLQPIYEATSKALSPDGRIRINFEAFKVDTGRFSTPQEKEGRAFTGKAKWNLHSIPATYDPHRPECMARIREVIKAEPGKKLYAIDYSGQELRVVTNLSHEPLWVQEFFRCAACGKEFDRGQKTPPPPEAPPPFCPECQSDKIGDLHTLTAIAIFGPDVMSTPEGKQRRGEAKAVNFALCYGGGGMAVVRAAGVTKEEGWRIKKQFDGTYKGLAGWWGRQHEFARRTKHVLTAFNRRYPLPDIDSADGGFRSKAERNAVNGPIQGTGADIMKWAMGLIYKECKKRGWLNRVKAIITIHDELVFEIDDDIAGEAVPVVVDIMLRKTIAKLAWRVPLTCDIECGFDWTVPWNITKILYGKKKLPKELEGVFVPHAEAKAKAEGGGEGGGEGGSSGGGAPPGEPEPGAPPASNGAASAFPSTVVIPTLARGEPFVYTLHSSTLSMRVQYKIAKVITQCRGRGTNPFRLVNERNEPLWDGEEILVNPVEVGILLNMPDV